MKNNPKEIKVKLNELTIAAKQWGSASGEPILALHGWLDNANSFDKLAVELDKLNLIAIDFPGHGLSDHLQAASIYHFIDSIPYVVHIADSLGWQHFSLLGHSMGAGIASLVAGVIPERINKLALIEGLGPLTATTESITEQLNYYLLKSKKYAKYKPKLYPSIESAAKVRANKGYLDLQNSLILAKRGLIKQKDGFIWTHDPRLLHPAPLRLTEQQTLAILMHIQAPTCLIMAEQGFAYGHELVQKRLQQVKNIGVHCLPGGHHIHMEKPKAIGDILRKFLT